MNPEEIRKEFPIFKKRKDLAYLDNAATSQKPQQVIDRLEDFYSRNNANIGRGIYDLANSATMEYENARSKVADFIGAKAGEVVFVRNTTEAENLLASSLDFEGGIVISEMAHHSEQLPWREKALSEGKEVSYLETEEGRISAESAREKIGQDTGVVVFSHISNVFGGVNPVEDIVGMAKENDALVVLDAAQSAPHMSLDVKDLDVDFMCFSGHKMLGPTGLGVLYGRKNLLDDMEPYQVGGGMIRKVTASNVEYEDSPERFEAGTPNIAGAVGLAEAVNYLEKIGMKKISRHSRDLSGRIRKGLLEFEEVDVLSPESVNLVSFTMEKAHPHDIAEILNQNDVAVRAGHHCAQPQMEKLGINGTVRASPYLYNTEDDVERLLEAVEEVKEVFG